MSRVNGSPVPQASNTSCQNSTLPNSVEVCNTAICPAFIYSNYSACTTLCGPGLQTRNAFCQSGNSLLNMTACGVPEPLTRECMLMACPTYVSGSFSPCTKSCGGGTSISSATCQQDGTQVDDTVCGSIGLTKPSSTTQSCANQACPSYSFAPGDFRTCNASCGGGFQTRPIQCIDSLGIAVSARFCSGQLLLNDTRRCNTQDCSLPVYTNPPFEACSRSCGGGNQTRSSAPVCIDLILNQTLPESSCAGVARPNTTQVCNTQACPLRLVVGNYSTCSTSCGGGFRTRNVACMQGAVVLADAALCAYSIPISTEACNVHMCPAWQTSYDMCDAVCGRGKQSPVLACVDGNGDIAPESQCGAKPQMLSLDCEAPDSCPTWNVSAFGPCSKNCNSGERSRQVTCRQNGEASILCQGEAPATTEACNTAPCGVLFYQTTSRGSCTAQCGQSGLVSLTQVCMQGATVMNESACVEVGLGNGLTEETCQGPPCPEYSYGQYGDCSTKFCGGTVTRPVECLKDGAFTTLSECEALLDRLPVTEKTCPQLGCGSFGICDEQLQCFCDRGFRSTVSQPCSIAPIIENTVLLDIGPYATSGVPYGFETGIRFTYNGDPAQNIRVSALAANSTRPEYLTPQVLTFAGSLRSDTKLQLALAAGQYQVQLSISDTVSSLSSSFTVASACAYYSCGAFGEQLNCAENSCTCFSGYRGQFCQTPPVCSAANPSCRNGGTCDSVTSSCSCPAGFSGNLCETEVVCTLACQNGGIADASCQACKCTGSFTGQLCDTCPITCSAGATPAAGCRHCEVEILFTFGFDLTDKDLKTLEKDISNSRNRKAKYYYQLSRNSERLGPRSVYVYLVQEPDNTIAFNNTSVPGRRLLQVGGIAAAFLIDLNDSNSDIANGLLTSIIDPSSIKILSLAPSRAPSGVPSAAPSKIPSRSPSRAPSTQTPSTVPSAAPTWNGLQQGVCEYRYASMSCEPGQVIDVTHALLEAGRECDGFYLDTSSGSSCPSTDVLNDVRRVCQDRKACKFLVSNFGGPLAKKNTCNGIIKMLQFSYLCKAPSPKFEFGPICRRDRVSLQCRTDEVIRSVNVTYGRTTFSADSCSDGVVPPPGDTRACAVQDISEYFRQRCIGRNGCNLSVKRSTLSLSSTCTTGYAVGNAVCGV